MVVMTGQYESIPYPTLKVINEILCSFLEETHCEELSCSNNKLYLYFVIFFNEQVISTTRAKR